MQILKVKTQADFDEAVVKEGTLLVFPEQQTDGSYLWRCKDSDGNIKTVRGGDPPAPIALANSGDVVINDSNHDVFTMNSPASGTTLDINVATFPRVGASVNILIMNPGANLSIASAITFPNEDGGTLPDLPGDKTVDLLFKLYPGEVIRGYKLSEV